MAVATLTHTGPLTCPGIEVMVISKDLKAMAQVKGEKKDGH